MMQLPYRAPAIPAMMGPSGGMFYGTYPIPPPPPYAAQNFALPGVGMPMMGFAPTLMMAPNNNAANKPLLFNPADMAAMQQMQMAMPLGAVPLPPNQLMYNQAPFILPQQPGFVDMNAIGYRPQQIHPVATGGRDFNPRTNSNNNITMNNMNVPNNFNNNMGNNGRQYNGNYNNSGNMRTNYPTQPYNNNQQGNGPRQPQHLNNNTRRPNSNNYNNGGGGNYNSNRNNSYNNNHNNSNNNSNNNVVNGNSNESIEHDAAAVPSTDTGEQGGVVASTDDAGIASTASVESQQNYNSEKNNNNVSSYSWDNSYDRKPSYPRSQNHSSTVDSAIKGSWSSDNNVGGSHHTYTKHTNQYSSNSNNATISFNGNNRQHFDGPQHSTSSNNNVGNTTSDDSEGRSNSQSGRSNSRNRRTDGSNSNTAYNNSALNKGIVSNSNSRTKVGSNNRNVAQQSDGVDVSNNVSSEKSKAEGGVAATATTDSVTAAVTSLADKTAKSSAESSASESRSNGQKGSAVRINTKNASTATAVSAGGKDSKDKRESFRDREKNGRKGDRKDKKGQDSEGEKTKKAAVELNFESDFPTLVCFLLLRF